MVPKRATWHKLHADLIFSQAKLLRLVCNVLDTKKDCLYAMPKYLALDFAGSALRYIIDQSVTHSFTHLLIWDSSPKMKALMLCMQEKERHRFGMA